MGEKNVGNRGRAIDSTSLRQRLLTLEIGNSIIVDNEEYKPSNIRTQASMLRCDFGFVYKVSVDTDRNTHITRMA